MQSPTPIEILTIGREILDGRVTDTNSTFLGYELSKRGLTPRYAQRVDDDPSRMMEAFKIAQSRSQIVLVTGGLGPTEDDLTAEVFSHFLGQTPKIHPQSQIREFFNRVQRPLMDLQLKQALLPPQAEILKNTEGTAPGFLVKTTSPDIVWFFMPGVPREMKTMFFNEVLPNLPLNKAHLSRAWCTHFTSEGELQNRLKDVIKQLKNFPSFELTFRTRFPENHIGLHLNQSNLEEEIKFKDLSQKISQILGSDVFHEGPETEELEFGIAQRLKSKNVLLGCVESCTGGLVSHRLTQISGISENFWGSWVTYDNSVKIDLGVNPSTLKNFGAVSKECALEMAESGLKKLKSLAIAKNFSEILCLSTSGIAGPTGGSSEKPVGLMFCALASTRHTAQTEKYLGRVGLDRASLKLAFSQKALDIVRLHLNSDGGK